MKRFFWASVAVLAVVAVSEFLLHGVILRDLYLKTASLWRPAEEIQRLSWLMWIGYVIYAPVFVYIYSKGVETGKSGLAQGFRYGFWIGLLMSAVSCLSCYAVMPIPAGLSALWFVGWMGEAILAGMAAGLIYKK